MSYVAMFARPGLPRIPFRTLAHWSESSLSSFGLLGAATRRRAGRVRSLLEHTHLSSAVLFGRRRISSFPQERIRNVAIIAHVDHGKTTLVDRLLAVLQIDSGTDGAGNRVMDSNALEKERGITILSKNTSVAWKDHQINIVDTPGHGDFGGEVERVLGMVDGVVLVVCGTEGPMTQTKFVLTKALAQGLKSIVVLNKMDRSSARQDEVETEIFDLYAALDAGMEQLDYPTLFASAAEGWIRKDGERIESMQPLLDEILESIPPPKGEFDAPFSMLVTTIGVDSHFGQIASGRIHSGKVKPNDTVICRDMNSNFKGKGTVMRVFSQRGLQSVQLDEGTVGDIVSIAGLPNVTVTDTICNESVQDAVPTDAIDPPVVSVSLGANSSPLAGKEGKELTITKIRNRIDKELRTNVAMQAVPDGQQVKVSGRGELHLGILLETMRREGFEMSVSAPEVVFKEIDGQLMEPEEEVLIEVEKDYVGLVIEKMSSRKGMLISTKDKDALKVQMVFTCLARSLLGLRSELATETRGTASVSSMFKGWMPHQGPLQRRDKGALVSNAQGAATGYALSSIESRGTLFIRPGDQVYEGMIVGENARSDDLAVNPAKGKHLSNVRTVIKDEQFKLTPPKILTLEDAISLVREDEMVELTPKNIRLRKKILGTDERQRIARSEKRALKSQ